MQTQGSIFIERPIAKVFATTLENVSAWSPTWSKGEVLESANDGGVGTTFRLVNENRGRPMKFRGVVTEHTPPVESRVALTGPYFDIDLGYTFEAEGAGTRVTQTSSLRGKGVTKLMHFLFGGLLRKSQGMAQAHELDALKSYCEDSIPSATS